MDPLLRLAELRVALARRDLAAAQAELRKAGAEVEAAREAAAQLAREQAGRRAVLRAPLLASPQVRGALEGVLTTFRADIEREAGAKDRVARSEAAVAAARDGLDQAKLKLIAADRRREARLRLRQRLLDRQTRDAEARDEADAEGQGRAGGRR